MSQSINGYANFVPPDAPPWFMIYWTNLPSWKKITQIRSVGDASPNPNGLFVFIDENEDTIFDGQFGNVCNPALPLYWPDQWWDMPANRHNQGANLSFADGHSEIHKWMDPDTLALTKPTSPRGPRDVPWMQVRTSAPINPAWPFS